MANGGLVSQAEQQLAQPVPDAGTPQSIDDGTAQPGEVPAEMQEAYVAAIQMASEILHKDETASDGILAQIEAAEGVAEGVAEATDLIMAQIEDAFEGKLPDEIILHVGDEISDLVMELADASGIEISPELGDQAKVLTGLKIMEEYGVEPTDYEENAATVVAQEDIAAVENIIAGAA